MTGPLDPDLVEAALRDQRLRDWIRGCLSKRRYPVEADALKYARRVARRWGERQRPYLCGQCNGYHLTSKPYGCER